MKKKISVLSIIFLLASQSIFSQAVVNYTFGPVLGLNSINTTQLDTFVNSWNTYYSFNMKKDYSTWKKTYLSKGFEGSIEYYKTSMFSLHMFGSMGMNWGKQVNESVLWNNFTHKLSIHYRDVPVLGGIGAKLGPVFIDYSIGANFRNAALHSTVTYPDGSTSMGYEMDILGYYESSIPKYLHGVNLSLRILRLQLTARALFPLKNKMVADNLMVDYDVNRFRQSEFPVDFNIFVNEVMTVNEENMLKATNLHGSIIQFSAGIVLGKIK